MRKKFKPKRKIKNKRLLIFFLGLFIYYIISLSFNYFKLNESKSNLVNYLLENSIKKNSNVNIFNKINTMVSKNVFNSPVSILQTEFGYKYNQEKLQNIKVESEEIISPKIYIYNSHQGEQYNYKYLENYNIVPDVLMASLMLKEKLENINIPTLVEESDILQYMKNNNLNHAGSYIASRYFLSETIKKYNDIQLYIDLHRDAAKHSVTYTKINGKDCAKILFVIGLENPNYQYNLDIVTKINNIIKLKYPTLTRGIMKKEGYGVNGVYNQDLSNNVILIEIGGNENNIDEVNNTLDIISEVIGEYLNEKK